MDLVLFRIRYLIQIHCITFSNVCTWRMNSKQWAVNNFQMRDQTLNGISNQFDDWMPSPIMMERTRYRFNWTSNPSVTSMFANHVKSTKLCEYLKRFMRPTNDIEKHDSISVMSQLMIEINQLWNRSLLLHSMSSLYFDTVYLLRRSIRSY